MSAAWVVLSSTAAILSIVFQAFGIRDLTKRYTESRSMAQALRLKIESYRNKLRIVTNWDLDALMKQLDEFDKENLAFLMQHPGDGMLETKFLMKASQDKLDHILQREISG